MRKLEVFFDYACPYCFRGHGNLVEVLPKHPDVAVVWRPCEAHPRPETHGPHSDLCIQGMLYALEQGADIWAYHERMYQAALKDRINIEDPAALAEAVRGLLDPDAFEKALQSGMYAKAVSEGNDYAYEQSGVWAIPSYRLNGRKLDAVEGVGVTKEQLAAFLEQK